MRLKDQIAIVTGGGSGFGRGICESYAREGARVVVADINEAGAQETASAIGSAAIAVKCDVTQRGDIENVIKEAETQFGDIDIVVNNAGYTHKNQPLLNVSEEEFDRVYAVNVKAIYLMTLAIVPKFEARGGGVIINVASTAGVRPRPGLTWYNGSKGAAIIISKSLAAGLGDKNIRVNAINPVVGETGMLEQFMGMPDTPENRAQFIAGIPRGRMSRPSDVANAAVFLAEPASEFITGVALEVDGGRCV